MIVKTEKLYQQIKSNGNHTSMVHTETYKLTTWYIFIKL